MGCQEEISIREQITRARIALYRKILSSENQADVEQSASTDGPKDVLRLESIPCMNGIDLTMTEHEHAMLADFTTVSTPETGTPLSLSIDEKNVRPPQHFYAAPCVSGQPSLRKPGKIS
jgi:hypothetical protein